MAITLSAGVPDSIGDTKSTSKILVQINVGDTQPIYLFGSLDGTNYVQLETFTASAIKEVSACRYLSVSATTGDHDSTASFGTTTASFLELSGF